MRKRPVYGVIVSSNFAPLKFFVVKNVSVFNNSTATTSV